MARIPLVFASDPDGILVEYVEPAARARRGGRTTCGFTFMASTKCCCALLRSPRADLPSTDFDFDQLDAGVPSVADLVTTAGIEEAPLSRLVELEAHGS